MIERDLVLNTIEHVKAFVQCAMTQEYEITLSSGNREVSAKSIMSIFSLDLTKPVRLKADCDNESDFAKAIEYFMDK